MHYRWDGYAQGGTDILPHCSRATPTGSVLNIAIKWAQCPGAPNPVLPPMGPTHGHMSNIPMGHTDTSSLPPATGWLTCRVNFETCVLPLNVTLHFWNYRHSNHNAPVIHMGCSFVSFSLMHVPKAAFKLDILQRAAMPVGRR